MSKLDQFKVKAQYVLPKHAVSRLMGKFASARAGIFTQLFMRWFIKHYQVDMSEAVHEEPSDYSTFNEFFTRPLKPEARPLQADDFELAHPVDGKVSQLGKIDGDSIIQAKNHDYSLVKLLGGDAADAAPYKNGQFATIYLAPRDYHRIHMPLDGTLRKMTYVPGDLFSVNPLTAANVPGLFARNERVVCFFDSAQGPFTLTLIGATIVASIETVWAGTVTPPTGPRIHSWEYPAQGFNAVTLKKGEEMGRFKLGSTVVLTFPDEMMFFEENLQADDVTRMGEVMGQLIR
ncbi:phosphatidylserine decarboxylase [Aliidiomarina sedimenti]|uniref:Phosphatidylserine decarboxylase proenzyme n=1 Tax=Aliidiomarina sedimenti TaxID=1933879 RepID=A0ABY0BY93_9GAMM|nr:archaetidylserine decarboxylase [Aliidiomarina sedimenti]RUO29394.1 phosphatidylserine decarboxylase [Aliidiomarina sedimenti]